MNKLQTLIYDNYIEYVNDFLTVERFAEYYEIPDSLALELINHGREISILINEGKLIYSTKPIQVDNIAPDDSAIDSLTADDIKLLDDLLG